MEEENTMEDKILHASSIIAAAKGKIKIRAAMRLVGFTDQEAKTMTLYQKIRRKSMNMCVVEKGALPKPAVPAVPAQIGDGAETVSSTLSSADRNDPHSVVTDADISTVNNSTIATTRTAATPRRILDSTPSAGTKRSGESVTETPKKKFRRSSAEVQRSAANVIMKTKKESLAMKMATVRIQQNKELPHDHPDKKSISVIVAAVNVLYDSNISPKTAAACVRSGRINTSPLKRGPCGEFSKAVFDSLKGAYSTYLMLEQSESVKQSAVKEMGKRVNACVNIAGHPLKSRDDLARKLRKETADLFTVGKANMCEQRRLQWTTHHNLNLWFSTFKSTLIELGFGRGKTEADVNTEGEVVFFPNQEARIINLDETDGTLDESHRNRGGRPPMVFTNPDLSGGATAANKSGYSSTIICGSNAAGEALPPHFQLKSLAQQDSTQRISVDWFVHSHNVLGKFGFDETQVLPTTFGLNEKGGMNALELDKYIRKAILPLYPDVADVPGKRVLLKVDSGPGRMNVEMLATLRLQGVHLAPGVPNTTHVTQETDQNYGLYKSVYRSNLRMLAEARQARRKTLTVSDLPLLVFGGYDYITKCRLANTFDRSFSLERNLACWKKCGAVPLTRLPLQSPQVRHELTFEGNTESKESQQLKDIAALNRFHCEVLTTHGYLGCVLRKEAPKMKKKLPAITVPQSKQRIKAIRNAKASGQLFHATGGQHLNSDEFFQARALAEREEGVIKLGKTKKNRLLVLDLEKEARALLEKKGPFTIETSQTRTFSKADIKLLCKWKGAKMAKVDGKIPDKKTDLAELYFENPDPAPARRWTEEDEEELIALKEEDVPLESTQLGVAAKQMAVATANNMSKLDANTRNQLLQSIAAFDMANEGTS